MRYVTICALLTLCWFSGIETAPNTGFVAQTVGPLVELRTLLDEIVKGNVKNLETAAQVISALLQAISYIIPPPSNIPDTLAAVRRACGYNQNSASPNLVEYAINLVAEGINPKNVQLNIDALTTFNRMNNMNPSLSDVIKAGDPVYSVPEELLRSEMYFPDGFDALNASGLLAIVTVPATAVPSGQS